MINDALAGKIDLILTKSVSRFARNTVDTLTTIRQLKEHGVAVHFEEQGIDTMDGKGELLITIMSSIAQEESRNISENVTWGKRKSAADGKISLAYKHFLGYEKGEDGLPKIVEEQAKIVRLIYRSYLEGKSAHQIAVLLTKMGVPSPAGRKKWQDTTVMSILTNEKYRGSAKLQKTYTIDFLQKKKKVNEGEVQQYYIEHSHDAIVTPTEFERVQLEIHRREAAGDHGASTYTFSSRIVCGECGAYYGRKVWHSNDDRYRRVIWRCNAKYKGSAPCRTTHLTEEEIKSHFIHAFNQLQAVREDTIEACRESISALCDLTELDAKIIGLREELSALSARAEQLTQSRANGTIEAADHAARSAAIAEKLAPADAELKRLQAERFRLVDLRRSLEYFIDFKYGLGVHVEAERNPQMMLYALGALSNCKGLYDIRKVSMTVFQPRRENISTWTETVADLRNWAEHTLAPAAKQAFAGEGQYSCGDWCVFCRAKQTCRARAEANLSLLRYELERPPLLSDDEIDRILGQLEGLVRWAEEI